MSNTDPLLNRIFSTRYQIQSLVGEGGMSRVYRALDIRTEKTVALKILKSEFNQDQEFLKRFQREAQAASLMNHHNIVTLTDVGVEDDMHFIVFEFINGSTLADVIRQWGKLPCDKAVPIAVRVLSALQHAHDRGIIHRDIKPQNILINEEGLVKVADFGIARIANHGTLSSDNMVLGSVHYSSPEQASGEKAEPPSDLYSVGIVLYEMITGRLPFIGDNAGAVALQQVQTAPPPIEQFAPDTPSALIAVIMRALEKKPENRFASAKDMAKALNDALEGKLSIDEILPPLPQNEKVEEKENKKKKKFSEKKLRTRIIAASAILLALAGILFSVFLTEFRQIRVPDVLDLSATEAEATLKGMNLNYTIEESFHPSIAAGQVIQQVPGPEEMMNRNGIVSLMVSKGPSDQDLLPEVLNMDYDNARTVLKERGIEDIVIVKTVSTLPVGTVISQSPVSGCEITEGMNVELTVSGGSTLIPSVVGKSREEASAILAEAELTEGTLSYAEVSADQLGTIVAQNPSPGSTAILGTAVTMTLGIESQPYIAEVHLDIAANPDKDRVLRIVLAIKDEEYIKYQSTINAGLALNEIIPIKSTLPGEQLCRIYLDNELFMDFPLNFN